MTNRLKSILPQIAMPFQSAFVPGRLITDNYLIAFDIFHYMRKKKAGRHGVMGLKLDMAKTYDRIEWSFLNTVLVAMSFADFFQSSRVLRQGDPLSPYLFISCAEVFSGLILKAQEMKDIHGVCIARRAPKISHLFFADDSIVRVPTNFRSAY